MSRPYGPVLLTAGVASFVDIDASASWIIVENSSLNLDLGVSFQVNQPPVVATFSGKPYSGVIQAGGAKRFVTPTADGTWTGRLWMLPISVATQSGQTGGGSAYSRAYVTSYNESEEPTDSPVGVIRGLDLTSQPRVVALPMESNSKSSWPLVMPTNAMTTGTVWTTSPALTDLNYAGQSYSFSPIGSHVRTTLSLYGYRAVPLTVGRCTFEIWPAFDYGAAGTPSALGSAYLLRASVGRAGVFGPTQVVERQYTTPYVLNFAVDALAQWISLYYVLRYGDGGMLVDGEIQANVDFSTNTSYPGSYGQNATYTVGDRY